MMHIDFKEPELTQDDKARAKSLVESMNGIIGVMKDWAKKPTSAYKVITASDRKQLLESGFPRSLVSHAAVFTEQVRRRMGDDFVELDEVMVGFTSEAFDSSLYSNPEVRRALVESHAGRCAYCETLINQSAYGDVEHFRPKAGYTVSPSPALFRPAYYDLAYDPRNLFLSCQLCNEAYKQNEFPVIGSRVPEVTVDNEVPVLINPYREDPREYIRFNPLNGQAYPFDLVKAFCTHAHGWGPPQTEQEIWKNPTLIPAQVDANGQTISNAEIDKAFQRWLEDRKTEDVLNRGTRTISILHLNRPPLVRARIDQLRQLRGIGRTAGAQNADQKAAEDLVRRLISADPGRAVLAPQYLSLTIDALQTWNLNAQAGAIGSYNTALERLARERKADIAPPPHNDALMYLVFESEYELVGKRRIVYLTDADRLYGDSGKTKGLFLAIDWDVELDNAVEIRNKKGVQLTTLRQLISGAPQGLWRTFKDSEVWAIGNYLPIKSTL